MHMAKKIHFKNLKSIFLSGRVLSAWMLTVTFVLFILSLAGASPDEEVKRIQDVYGHIKDIKGSFVQKSHIKDLERTDTYKGTFFIKQPMKVKWNYGGAAGQEVLINDDEIIIYQKKEKQAFRGLFNADTYGRAPIALLSGFGKIQEEFSVTGKDGTLLLKPKKLVSSIKSIELELCNDEFPIRSFTIYDSHDNKIVITLEDVKINSGLKDSMFEPSLPEDTTFFENNF
jgi:outer membrane lipoprotein carrier protein